MWLSNLFNRALLGSCIKIRGPCSSLDEEMLKENAT